jgi:hypothetical protein
MKSVAYHEFLYQEELYGILNLSESPHSTSNEMTRWPRVGQEQTIYFGLLIIERFVKQVKIIQI